MTINARRAGYIAAMLLLSMGTGNAQPMRDLTIGLASTSMAVAPAMLAKEMGLYEKQGLNAKFVTLESANVATAALIARSFEVIVSGPGDLVAAQSRGQKVVVVANLYGGFGASMILAKGVADKLNVSPTAPASERLKALDGLLIGSISATGTYTNALRGATEPLKSTVRFTYMGQNAMVPALETGAIQGFFVGAPVWAFPVVKGNGVLWLSGPKGDLPPEYTSASSGSLQAMREFAEANPELMKKLAAVFEDFRKAIEERPADVRAAVAKLYPDVDGKAMDLLLSSELLVAWKAKPLTRQDMAREIAFIKMSGSQLPDLDKIDPGSLVYP